MNERDNFITQMNNDLKNPLYVILGSLDLLEKEAQTQVQIDLIKRAKNNGEILMNMMNNILIDYKIQQGRVENDLSSIEVRNLI